ncbi:MAG: MFS transporter [Candidatus Dormiibacterota bacterium]|jgi:predicted MFS family arabinose efflux permease
MRPDAVFRPYLGALQHPDLRLLLSGEVISSTGSWAYNVGLAVYIYDRTHSALWVSAVFLVRFIPAMVLSPYGGIIAERFERVRLLITCDLVLALWQALLCAAALAHGPVLLILGLAACSSITAQPYQPAVAAMIPQLAGEDDLAAANALNSTIDNLVIIVGPAVGALLLLSGSASAVFAVNGASFLLAAALVSRLRARSQPSDVSEGGTASPLQQVVAGFRAMGESSVVLALVSFSVLASFVYGTDTVLFVYVSKFQLGTGATGYGYLLAALGVGGILAALVVNQLAARPRLGLIITVGMAVYCVPTALLVLVHAPAVGFILEVIRGGGTLVVDVLAVTAMQRSVPPNMVARVFGAFFALVLAAISLGSVLVATLVSRLGLHPSLLLAGLAIPAIAACAYPRLRRMDGLAVRRVAELAPRIALLEPLGIFAAGSRAALESLAAACTDMTASAGQVIIREGDPADAFYVLLGGAVQVSARGEAKRSRVLRVMGPGSYFGEIGLLAKMPRTATVKALEPCALYRISGTDFVDALTASTPSGGFLEGAKTRLARSHPSYAPTLLGDPMLDLEH